MKVYPQLSLIAERVNVAPAVGFTATLTTPMYIFLIGLVTGTWSVLSEPVPTSVAFDDAENAQTLAKEFIGQLSASEPSIRVDILVSCTA